MAAEEVSRAYAKVMIIIIIQIIIMHTIRESALIFSVTFSFAFVDDDGSG